MTDTPHTRDQQARDYQRVSRAIAYIDQSAKDQPSLDDVAREMGLSPCHAQRVFSRWAGISPKQFLGYLTHGHARALLTSQTSVLDTAYDVGLSGPGRLHDLCLSIEALTPGEIKRRGAGLTLFYGFHNSPFGTCLIFATDQSVAGLAFVDGGDEQDVFADMSARWPAAAFRQEPDTTRPYADRIFVDKTGDLKLILAGTPFQLKTWEALLRIPPGRAVSYAGLANFVGRPRAVRAVASAVGRNPIAYLIPCHRVLRNTGSLGGYHWGLSRKRALLAWESAQLAQTELTSSAKLEMAMPEALKEMYAGARS